MARKRKPSLGCNRNGVSIGAKAIHLDGFEFVRPIGSGANGHVFEAIDLLGRRVAVKFWLPSSTDHRSKLKQGLAEAKKMAHLDDDRIARIYTAGALPKAFYVSMELLNGVTLKEHLAKSDVSISERRSIWSEIWTALKFVHAKGEVHGDLHADNVMVVTPEPNRHRRIVLLDFGTSMFNRDREKSRRRASMFIEELAALLFPGRSGYGLRNKTRTFQPDDVLDCWHAWVELIESQEEIMRHLHGSDENAVLRARDKYYTIQRNLLHYPLLDVEEVVDWARRERCVEFRYLEKMVISFLDYELFLSVERGKDDDYRNHMAHKRKLERVMKWHAEARRQFVEKMKARGLGEGQ